MEAERYGYQTYVNDVLAGRVLTCKKTRQAVERHVRDLERSAGDFPYYFDPREAEKVIDFLQIFKHYKAPFAGMPFILEPWQQFIIACIYGWKRKSDRKRRFRTVYFQVAKKNGKTILLGALSLLHMIFEEGAEVYSIASSYKQAKRAFTDARIMAQNSPIPQGEGKNQLNILTNNITYNNSLFEPRSAEYSRGSEGTNASFLIVDELHQHPNSELLHSYASGMVARDEPLTFIITTAGTDKTSVCYEEYQRAGKILDGVFTDETYFTIIYELDPQDKWDDKSKWIKANPNLNVSVKMENLEADFTTAQQKPSERSKFKTKNLDMWVDADVVWIEQSRWRALEAVYTEEDLIGRECIASLDLSRSNAFTSLTYTFFPYEDVKKYRLLNRYWTPGDLLDRKKAENPYIPTWVDQGFIYAPPGEIIDYEDVFYQILEDSKKFTILMLVYDRYSSVQLINRLKAEKLPYDLVEFPQTNEKCNTAVNLFEESVIKQTIEHDGNPVTAWMLSNASLTVNRFGLKRLDKSNPKKYIDGIDTSTWGLDVAVNSPVTKKLSPLDKYRVSVS